MNSTSAFLRPCTWVYLVLIALTFTTYAVGELGLGGLSLALLVLGIALVKGHLVGDFFMGLHGLRGPWRWVILIWLTLLGGLITLAFTRTA
ncbi:MAG: cytochrome C oxidase subunit IV family protein [Chromatiaceae bacterium]|nr:cytochrome C oxidase subunit IV family protein [Chromatiaceae bacterium]MBP8288805.1 cytochrome C oxidase subunit IV family protein [Chromatiaceae bacterium]HSO79213.1 cytochrome C oxidase subunit IV family protein [Chromatiaceae bacterium]